MSTTKDQVFDTCEACQNWGANHAHDHDNNSHSVVVKDEDKEQDHGQVVPVYVQKTA